MRAVSARMPDTMRGRSSACSVAAALEELGVGRHRGDRRAQLVRGVGDELAQVLLVLPQPGLGRHAGGERGLDPLEHHVERPRQPADLGRLVGPGDPLVEVAGRDGVGGALDVLERPQAEPDQPPSAGQRQHEGTGRDGELGQEQGVQGARLVDEWYCACTNTSPPCWPESRARTRNAGPPEAMEPGGEVRHLASRRAGCVNPVMGEGSWGR